MAVPAQVAVAVPGVDVAAVVSAEPAGRPQRERPGRLARAVRRSRSPVSRPVAIC